MKRLIGALIFAALLVAGCSHDETTNPAPGPEFKVIPATMHRSAWQYTSVPISPSGAELTDVGRGLQLWFSPPHTRLEDVNPWEFPPGSVAGRDFVLMMEFIYSAEPPPDGSAPWGGLVTALSPIGVPVQEYVFLDVWLNDRLPVYRNEERRGTVYIDVGEVSEDAVWDPLVPPTPSNATLDAEDRNRSGGPIEWLEDTGLDLVFSPQNVDGSELEPPRPDGRTGWCAFLPEDDPAGDDKISQLHTNLPEPTLEERIAKYRGINGTERNQIADTEDLNFDFFLNRMMRFRTYRVDLGAPAHVDVSRDWTAGTRADNGWRLYRIPLADFVQEVGRFDPDRVKHIRLWVADIPPGETLDLQIAFVGLADAETPPLGAMR